MSYTIRNLRMSCDSLVINNATIDTSNVTSQQSYTLPNVTDTLVTLNAQQTLTNKVLTNPTINNVAISGSASTGQVLQATGSTAANWATLSSIQKYGLVTCELSTGTNAGSAVINTWTTRTITNLYGNSTNISINTSTNKITLNAGKYALHCIAIFNATNSTQLRLQNTTDNSTAAYGLVYYLNSNSGLLGTSNQSTPVTLNAYISINSTKDFQIQYFVGRNSGSTALGIAAGSGAGIPETYMSISIYEV
jgi:hypothetical protein